MRVWDHCHLKALPMWELRARLASLPTFCYRKPWYHRQGRTSDINKPSLIFGSVRAFSQRAATSMTISSLLALIWALEHIPMLFVLAMMTMACGIWPWILNISKRWFCTSSIFKSASKWYSNCWNTLSSGYLCLFLRNFGIKCCKCWSPSNHTASFSVIIQCEYIFEKHLKTSCLSA